MPGSSARSLPCSSSSRAQPTTPSPADEERPTTQDQGGIMAERRTGASALAPLTGALFVILTVVSFIVGGEPPDADDRIGEVVEYWTDNDAANFAGAVLEGLAAVSLLFFAASLRRALRRTE